MNWKRKLWKINYWFTRILAWVAWGIGIYMIIFS